MSNRGRGRDRAQSYRPNPKRYSSTPNMGTPNGYALYGTSVPTQQIYFGKQRRESFENTTSNKQPQKKGKSKDLNVMRDLPSTFQCNQTLVKNQFKPCTRAYDVKWVDSFHSAYTIDPISGQMKSNLIDNLVKMITKYGANCSIVGCVAWITNARVLEALKTCRRVSLIVNREDYNTWGQMLDRYDSLPRFDEPFSIAFEHLESCLSGVEDTRTSGASRYKSIRAFGNAGFTSGSRSGGIGVTGLEHNKYFVFFKQEWYSRDTRDPKSKWVRAQKDVVGDGVTVTQCAPTHHTVLGKQTYHIDLTDDDRPKETSSVIYKLKETPFAVWTGSMNVTKASEGHHENAVLICSEQTATSYFHDFAMTFMSSTPVKSKSKTNTPKKYSKMEDV